ncbi:uncharacterized protein C2845_PM03G17690 [Panicum miliaceum]|uniref:NB-ARC domain-containing protein n=1 Tax=Panicum miliaceum TaxID=4540 RepID=A0A3L6T776_PANMI|nr:uncharacterized protein C2845_PM03G17690 [Panicum miliaceum]
MPEQVESNESEQLQEQVQNLCDAMEKEVDSNLPGRDDLEKICEVLKEIKGKITPVLKDGEEQRQELLPLSKREELGNLLPTIEHALQQRKQPRRREPEVEHPADMSSAGCYPCKPRPSQQKQSKQEDDEAVSLKLLLRLTQNVLEPEQYYEWTTSRIYGWGKEADEVAEALVAPEDSENSLFRAAGIAGVHGSGKTALAQKVFVHDKAKDNFALRLWVCVGPPDSEDRFGLLYRMLDNLGLDTAKTHRDAAEARIRNDPAKLADIQKKAAAMMKHKEETDTKKKEEQDGSIFDQLLKEEADESPDVQKSKIGVLLYFLHMSLSKTSYLIVFDDIRAYGDDGWYSNLTLPPPPEGEWGDRLGYGLPKGKHRGAVLVTCRKDDDARSMVRTGRVVRPPRLGLDDAWKLFRREYHQAKDPANKRKKDDDDDDMLKELGEMKAEIVNKCLGLPVAIAEAAKGFALLKPLPDASPDPVKEAKPSAEEESKAAAADDR